MIAVEAVAREATFTVYGVAQPQGSKTAFVRGNRAILTDGRRKGAREAFAGWRASVATAARDYQERHHEGLFDGPLAVTITFYLPRPKTLPKRVLYPATRPDLDKLTRAVFDALSGVIIADDARVVEMAIGKRFATETDPPHAFIAIREMV